MQRKNKIAVIILALAGIALLLWPSIHSRQVQCEAAQAADVFISEEKTMPQEGLYAAMKEYNQTLAQGEQVEITDSSVFSISAIDLSAYDINDEIIGAVEIPAIEIKMPVYLGASNEHLAKGLAHMGYTSLPIGGENTNCVLAGHRGWNGADYLRYIDRLKIGDEVLLTNLWETLHYQVTDIQIISPEDIDAIKIQSERDLLTLLSCHPYASGGRQRIVVYCDHVK